MATERCLTCRSTVGMASRHAVGLWEDGIYHGGICPNCMFYPERQSSTVRALLERLA